MMIIICVLFLLLGFLIGMSFYSVCMNELAIERVKHSMTTSRMIELHKKIATIGGDK